MHTLSHVRLFVTPCIRVRQAPLSMEFFRQEYWNGLPFHTPGDLPNPRIKSVSLASPALAGRFFTNRATWNPNITHTSEVSHKYLLKSTECLEETLEFLFSFHLFFLFIRVKKIFLRMILKASYKQKDSLVYRKIEKYEFQLKTIKKYMLNWEKYF